MSALENRKYVLQCEYDFDKDGGAVGDIAMRGGSLPIGAIVTSGMVYVPTAVTSGGSATVALQLESAGDILAATGKASFTAGATITTVPVNTGATAIITTATGGVTLTVATAALTAGKVVVLLDYYLP